MRGIHRRDEPAALRAGHRPEVVHLVSRRANLSESQFTRIFRRQTETSPAQYIVQTRINAARTLLETTDKLLTDIAAETGFYDHAHFVKTFKRIVGTTPSRYRKQHWQGQS